MIEPSAAVAVAALIAMARRDQVTVDDIGLILSGGNVDLARLRFGAMEA